MNAAERLLHALQAEMPTPTTYGWLHILFLVATLALTVFLCFRLRHAPPSAVRRLLLCVFLLMAVSEIYKQLVFSMTVTDGVAEWSYSWYAFPYQLCSTPIYVLPVALLARRECVRDAALSYLSSYAFFGGLAVMIYPGDVFTHMIGINLQTMLHHGSQLLVGAVLLVWLRRRLSLRFFARGCIAFLILTGIALLLDVGGYHALQAAGRDDTFNMFFISPYFASTLPILSAIQPHMPYPLFLFLYVAGFTLIAALFHGVACWLRRLPRKQRGGAPNAAR